MNYAQIGQKVRLAREEAGLSQEELGNRLGCSGVTISSWETGKRRISLEDLHSVARVLGKPFAFFFPDGSLSLNVENQIGALLKRSIGDFLGTKQIPVYQVQPAGEDHPSPWIKPVRHMSVASHLAADFALVIPDDRLSAVGITAGDVAVCRRYDGNRPQEDCLVLSAEGASCRLCLVGDGGEGRWPAEGGAPPAAGTETPEAVSGILVYTMKHAQDILSAVRSKLNPENHGKVTTA